MHEQILHDLPAFDAALRAHARVLLFKHSPACGVSAAARAHWDRFGAGHPDVPLLFVDVIADRPVARGIAERCGVAHASPQAILFVQGRPVWHASHGAITAGALEAAWAGPCC
jgi:bacillithiol system protein YtxJ